MGRPAHSTRRRRCRTTGTGPWMRRDATSRRGTQACRGPVVHPQKRHRVLAELGYAVDEGFQTSASRRHPFSSSGTEWTAHGVRLRLDDETGKLTAIVVRTESVARLGRPTAGHGMPARMVLGAREFHGRLRAKGVSARWTPDRTRPLRSALVAEASAPAQHAERPVTRAPGARPVTGFGTAPMPPTPDHADDGTGPTPPHPDGWSC
jgi:hypothetical protein